MITPTLVDYPLLSASGQPLSNEAHRIPGAGPYLIALNQWPVVTDATITSQADNVWADLATARTMLTVTVGGSSRTLVDTTPSAGQVQIQLADPQYRYSPFLVFNAADAGQTALISYTGLGTVNLARYLSDLFTQIARLDAFPPLRIVSAGTYNGGLYDGRGANNRSVYVNPAGSAVDVDGTPYVWAGAALDFSDLDAFGTASYWKRIALYLTVSGGVLTLTTAESAEAATQGALTAPDAPDLPYLYLGTVDVQDDGSATTGSIQAVTESVITARAAAFTAATAASAGVTFEALDAAGDVGTGADQVAQGDHDHDGVYQTVLSNAAGLYAALSDVTAFVETDDTIPIANGGTGQTTAQTAIDALTEVSSAVDGYVLTKSGDNAVFAALPLADVDTVRYVWTNATTITVQAGGQFTNVDPELDASALLTVDSNTAVTLSANLAAAVTLTANTRLYVWGGLDSGGTLEFWLSDDADTLPAELSTGRRLGHGVMVGSAKTILPFSSLRNRLDLTQQTFRPPVVNTGSTLPGVLRMSQAAILGNYAYLFGGMNASATTNVIYRAALSTPTTWTNTGSTLPGVLRSSQLAVIGSYVYLFGGYNASAATNVIYRAAVSTPTSWSALGSTLPGVLRLSQLAVIGDTIYLFGGSDASAATNVIYYAPVAYPDSWNSAGSTLPGVLSGSQLAVIGSYVYLFGGNDGSASAVIYAAPVSSPTSWVNTGAVLPAVRQYAQLAVIGDTIYLFGGRSDSAAVNTVYAAPVSDPTAWRDTGMTLPAVLQDAQAVTLGDYVYVLGGYSAATTNTIYRAPLSTHYAELTGTDWLDTGGLKPASLSQLNLNRHWRIG